MKVFIIIIVLVVLFVVNREKKKKEAENNSQDNQQNNIEQHAQDVEYQACEESEYTVPPANIQQSTASTMKTCPNCGAEGSGRFCEYCGKPLL